jgi:DNA modification methylase
MCQGGGVEHTVNLVTVSKGAVYIAMSSSERHTLQAAFTSPSGKWSTFIIWAKNTSTLRRAGYQRQYEPILYGWPCMHSAWNKPVPVPLTIPYPISPANEELTLRSGGVDQVG